MPIEAVIFDMDGVLLDSEPFWQDAEIAAFGAVGLRLAREDCRQTMGLRIDEVVAHWQRKRPDVSIEARPMEAAVLAGVADRIRAEGAALPGALGAIEAARARVEKVGLCTSSPTPIIEAVFEALDLRGAFDAVTSAEREPYGKPHPGVYLTAAAALGVAPTACLAIEDSLNGVLAAKAARMRCLAVPDPAFRGDPRFAIADLTLDALTALDEAAWARLLG